MLKQVYALQDGSLAIMELNQLIFIEVTHEFEDIFAEGDIVPKKWKYDLTDMKYDAKKFYIIDANGKKHNIKKDNIYKKQIKDLFKKIDELYDEINDIAKKALDFTEYKLIYKDLKDKKPYPDIEEGLEWYNISTEWNCPDSPFGYCMYHKIHDPAQDSCEFCGQPKERK
jgi:hypothetical protein